jgi:hypothetical protein
MQMNYSAAWRKEAIVNDVRVTGVVMFRVEDFAAVENLKVDRAAKLLE